MLVSGALSLTLVFSLENQMNSQRYAFDVIHETPPSCEVAGEFVQPLFSGCDTGTAIQ